MRLTEHLHLAAQAAELKAKARLRHHGLSPRSVSLLEAVAACPGGNQTYVMTVTKIDRSTVASMMSAMVEKGFVRRARGRVDARELRVTITEEGRHRMLVGRDICDEVDREIAHSLPRGAAIALYQYLGLMMEASRLAEVAARQAAE